RRLRARGRRQPEAVAVVNREVQAADLRGPVARRAAVLLLFEREPEHVAVERRGHGRLVGGEDDGLEVADEGLGHGLSFRRRARDGEMRTRARRALSVRATKLGFARQPPAGRGAAWMRGTSPSGRGGDGGTGRPSSPYSKTPEPWPVPRGGSATGCHDTAA